jgi:hypothetical protein
MVEGQGADEIAALSGSGGDAPRSEVQKAKRVWSGPAEGWPRVEGQWNAPARCGEAVVFVLQKHIWLSVTPPLSNPRVAGLKIRLKTHGRMLVFLGRKGRRAIGKEDD